VLIAALLGTTLGAMAALIGGAVEAVIGWVGAVQIALPATLVTLLLLAFTTRRISYVVLALVLLQWPRHALIAHQAVVNHSAVSWWRGLLKSFPALALAQLAGAIALEATLSFLGLGLPNTMPSLGVMIANGTDDLLHGRFWTTFWPGLALVALVITSNLVAWRLEMPVCRDLQRGG
jgi:peptide/nickel transport system permease protein